jgi:hypothetical protein
MLTSCAVGTYSIPSEITGREGITTAGEQVTVTDNWPEQSAVEVMGFVVVFYNAYGTEVGSVAAGPQEGFQNATTDMYPYPVYLTFEQAQTWTLEAGWTGVAASCTVVKLTSSPQVPQGQLGE